MKQLRNTYCWTILLSLMIIGCASENRDAAKAYAPSQYEEQEMTIEEDVLANKTIGNSGELKKESNNSSPNSRKWKKKARQQLETIQDLALILQDSTLDINFKSEI